MPISKETAEQIALAYREVETAKKLLAEITQALERQQEPDIRDAFGRNRGGLELGVPLGQGSQRLFNVPWPIARHVIKAHIAQQQAVIDTLSEKARIELASEQSTS